MCNLYSVTTNQEAIRRLFRVQRDYTGNMPPLPGIFPDQLAPVVRTATDAGRELLMMRWGFPPPPNLAARNPSPTCATANRRTCVRHGRKRKQLLLELSDMSR